MLFSTTKKKIVFLSAVIAASFISNMANAEQYASTLDKIKQTHILKLGVAPGDPWYYKNPITDKWDGVGYRLGEQIAKDLGAKVVPVETTYGNAAASIQSGQVDLFLVLDATPGRKKALSFPSTPLLWYKQGILVRDGLKVKNWQDLNDPKYRIGVALGTATDRDLTARLPKATIKRFANTDETIAAFMAHRIDAFAFYHPALAIAKSRIHMGNVIVPKPVVELPTSGGVMKGDTKFVDFLNVEFKKLNQSGETQKIFASYMKSKGLDPKEIPSIEK